MEVSERRVISGGLGEGGEDPLMPRLKMRVRKKKKRG